MVPRESWLPDARGQRITGQNLSRLRELTTEFDFSILWCRSGLLAHGQHWPGLRRPGAGVDRQQNPAPRRRPNQGSTQQSASSSARDRPRGTSFSCAARPLPGPVNLMGGLTTNRLWNTGPKDGASQFARMILGTPAIPPSRFAPTTKTTFTSPVNTIGEITERHVQPRALPQQHLSQPAVDRFTLCELVAADLIVLVIVCGALSLFSPAWGLPWAYAHFCGPGNALRFR